MTAVDSTAPKRESGAPAHPLTWWQRSHAFLWGLAFVIGASLTLALQISLEGPVTLAIGDVSPIDIRSPRQVTYESQVLTEQARARAVAGVPDVYNAPETRIRREQVVRAREILNYIDSVRHDSNASPDQRAGWIESIPDAPLALSIVKQLLALNEEQWRLVAGEVPVVLDRILREEIREDQIAVYQRRAASLVSLDLTDDEAAVATELVRALIRPNTFFNAERTQAEQDAARAQVPPQMRTLEAREIILRAGDIVEAADNEALDVLGLRKAHPSLIGIIQATLLVLLVTAILGIYLYRLAPEFWNDRRWPPLLTIILLSFLILARLLIPNRTLLPLLFPMAGMTMLLGVLLDLRISVLATVGLTVLIGYMSNGVAEMMTYFLLGGFIGAFILGRGERLSIFAWAGLAVTLANLVILLVFQLPTAMLDVTNLLPLAAIGIANGVLSVTVASIGISVLGSLFGATTSFQLMELSRPTHPLLRQLLLKAPGTYHHTILVSNLGERAAEIVGADPLLTRVGAYYHDVGKTLRPYFFVDNQADGVNPHDQLDPYTSAQIIISHVKDGLEMARRHRLPARIQEFIPQHHGTTLVGYFYHKAVQAAGDGAQVDAAGFHYPGPRPQSKEAAIVMLADSCESAVRASRPTSREEIDQVVRKIINRRLLDGELDGSALTLQDLDQIRRAFVSTLQGIHHPRIQYPEIPRPADQADHAAAPEPARAPGKPGQSSAPIQGNGGPGNGVG